MAIPKPNIATAAKTATISAAVNADVLAAAAKQSPLINPNQVQNQGTDGSSQDNKPRPGFEGPSPNIPGVSKPGYTPATADSKQATINNALGLVSKTDAMKQLAGVGTSSTAAQSEKDKLTDLAVSSKNNKTDFYQGFESKPISLGVDPVSGLNPMEPYQGSSLGEPLAGAATDDPNHRGNGIAGQGIGAVSTEPSASDKKDKKVDIDYTDLAVDAAKAIAKKAWAIGTFTVENGALWLAGKVVKDSVNEGQLNYKKQKNEESADEAERQADLNWVRAREAYLKGQSTRHIPDPENTGSNVNILTQSLLDQLNASKGGQPMSKGGSGDFTPVREAGVDAVARNGSIAVNTASVQGQKLFGQPGGSAIGENVSGGNKGIDGFGRSNGAGAIDPGNEAGIPGGDPRFQQDPANALGGNKPAPTLQSPVGTQENQSSSVSTTLAAGARNLTLTGMAAINGSGNALDNVIYGNSAANELRGEAGNDTLDGKVGNDLLDGGSGHDQLTGGSGADRFRFATAGAFGSTQADRITDFSRSEGDRIELSRSAFGLAAGASLSFQTVSNDADLSRALGSSTLLVQDLRDGSILFNQNGLAAGVGQGGVFAVVSQGLTLQAGDFALGA
jgi:Ca2+-binding RTX toxin-like protein